MWTHHTLTADLGGGLAPPQLQQRCPLDPDSAVTDRESPSISESESIQSAQEASSTLLFSVFTWNIADMVVALL